MPIEFVSAEQFNESGLVDWRYLLGAIEATFVAGTFRDGAAFVAEIATLADTADHHPEIALQYPGVVRIKLTTHSHRGLTSLDTGLAESISSVAEALGLRSEPTRAERIEVAIDAMDIDAIRPFWAAVLGYREGPADPEGMVSDLVDPDAIGPGVWFQQMTEPRSDRNRIHFDISVPHDDAEGRVAAVLAAGGRLVSDDRAKAFWVLADAEGNEACICTWQDRN
ncbi:MAG: VOC family protein [Acidimicrobiales bacterium]